MLFGGAAEIAAFRERSAPMRVVRFFRNAERFEIQEQSFLLPNEQILTLLILPEEATEDAMA